MKQLKNLFFALALCAPLTAAAQDIVINEENFPDESFRNWLLEQDYGADGVITETEIAGITSIGVSSKNISSLKGIEHFTALTSLDCYNNQLTTLDVSNNTALTTVECSINQLTALDVSNNTELTRLYCSLNQLTTLDVSNNTELWSLQCYRNQLTALDISNNTALEYLHCYNNQLTALDVSNNTELTYLACDYNQLTALDVSKNTKLTELCCGGNLLTALDVPNNMELKYLRCYENQLTALDVSNNTELTLLECYSNQIKGESMDALVSSLPETTNALLRVYSEKPDDNEGNIITKSQVAAAKAKGWTSFYITNGWQWLEYEGVDDTATSIALPEITDGSAVVYTLDGRKVATPQKGVNIIRQGNGTVQKVRVK